jgi:hypothetical protein
LREENSLMASLLIEINCPEHGAERYKIKIIKKHNINAEDIIPKFRTRPKHELSAIIVGRNVSYDEARDYALRYLDEAALLNSILSIRLLR